MSGVSFRHRVHVDGTISWGVRWREPDGRARSKAFERKVDAEAFDREQARIREERRQDASWQRLAHQRETIRERRLAHIATIELGEPTATGAIDLLDDGCHAETAFTYQAIGSTDEVLYVGSTTNLRARLRSHRGVASWWFRAVRIEWAEWPDEPTARAEETKLIRLLAPQFNIVGIAPFQRAEIRREMTS